MTSRTRAFVLVALAVVVLGVGTAGLASYIGFDRSSLLGGPSHDELAILPDDVELVAYADVRDLMASELGSRLGPELRPRGGRDPLLEQTGIDLEHDVDGVYLVVLPGAGQPLVVARGRFDRPRIEALVLSRNGAVTDYQNIRLATVEPDVSVAFVEADVVAVGVPSAVRRLLDVRAGQGVSVQDSGDMMRLVERVADADMWTVGRIDALRGRAGVPDLPAQLPAITWFAARGDVGQDVSAAVHAEAQDAQAADDLREIIRGMVALVRVQVGEYPGFAAVLDSIEMTTEGTTVSLVFSIPSQVLDRLGGLGSRLPAAAPPREPSPPSRARAQGPPTI